MALEQTAPRTIKDMLEPLPSDGFRFACHPDVPCFTECCRDLNLMLTPYDIARLRKCLGIDSSFFLDRYTETVFDERYRLPMITLKMSDNEKKSCPFVSPAGCGVYSDRPSSCRIYPLARASRMHRMHGKVQEDYFIVREEHCRGFEQERRWTAEEWIADQGLETYHELNNLWMDIVTHPQLRRGKPLSLKQQQMFYLASYNADQFRSFIFQGRFLDLFEWGDEDTEAFRDSDEALLGLAFRWLKFSLFNEPTLKLRGPRAE